MSEIILVTDEKYEGKYVAMKSFADREVVASGDDPVKVMKQAKDKGIVSPFLHFVPERDITLIY